MTWRNGAKPQLLPDPPSVSQISHVISQATAPAFLLGALAAFISVLIVRLNRVIDRSQALTQSTSTMPKGRSSERIFRARKTALSFLNNSMLFASISAIVITILVVVAVASALLDIQHERGAAVLFTVSLGLFAASLVNLARETRIALHEFDCL